MSTVIVLPLPFVASPSSPVATAPIANASNDVTGMGWVAPLAASYFVLDLGTAAYDYVALIGTNLRSQDTVRVRTGNDPTGTGALDSGTVAAWTGVKPSLALADTIFPIGPRTERYMRVDVTAPAHPDGYVTAFRIVVGKAIVAPGIDVDAEMGFEDSSPVTKGPGYTFVDPYVVLPTMKVSLSWTKSSSWKGEVYNMLQVAGNQRGILFIMDTTTPDTWQTDAMYARITSKVGGKAVAYDLWTYELQLTAYTP